MVNGRRASIHDHHAEGGGVEDKAEMLRDSLAELRESLSAANASLVKEETEEARERATSVAKMAAVVAIDKVEKKTIVKGIAADAAIKGVAQMEERNTKEAKRRMSVVAAEAASQVEDQEAHDDEGSNHVVPEWQEAHRRRGSSIAMDAATLISNKKEQKRKGSMVAMDASKMAIVFGTADHHD